MLKTTATNDAAKGLNILWVATVGTIGTNALGI
jgi:hypothetical protein